MADPSSGAHADLLNALKRKIQSLDEVYSHGLESLSPNVRKRVEILKDIQGKHDELVEKFLEEREALEAKYQALYQPLYTKRFEIVNGVAEVEGVANEPASNTEEDKEKGVPSFWLNAMKNNDALADEILKRDEGALKFLKDIKWSRIEEPKGFKLEFFFDSNPYFLNSVLTKSYHMLGEDKASFLKAMGTEIQWHPGKCLTEKVLKKRPMTGAKNAKPTTKTEKCESFFNFFSPPQVPDDAEDDDGGIDEDTAEEIASQMEQDYDIGSTIRDNIIPHAVLWFTGEAIQGEEFEDFEDEEGDDEEDEDEDDDDDDDDDEDEEQSKTKKKKSRKAQFGDGGEQPPECTQQ